MLVCNSILKRNCQGSQGCVNLRDARLLSSPLPTTSGGLAPELLSEAQSILKTATGPDDYAVMGDAVTKLANLVQHKSSIQSSVAEQKHTKVAQQLKAATLHLFPFIAARYSTIFSSQQDEINGTQGLVVPCGAADFQFAVHLVAAVRLVFHSSLPIEIMYAGDTDLSQPQRKALEAIGQDITTINILHLCDERIAGLEGGGWAIKPFAILASSFQHIIIADSDSVFLQTPEAAFDHPGYIATGTLFFHDRIVYEGSDVHDWWHTIMRGRPHSQSLSKSAFWSNASSHEMESGLIVFNKGNSNVLLGLLFAAWMNTKLIRSETTYKHTLGAMYLHATTLKQQ